MLSRIAEAMFWIGRYVERADATARILDVHVQNLLEDPTIEEDFACRSLLEVMGVDVESDLERDVSRSDVFTRLAFDRANSSSIAGAISSARSNARGAREVVSTELWEVLNTAFNRLPRSVSPNAMHEFFAWVQDRSAVISGLTSATISRDDSWQFLHLGRSLERADMTARMIATTTFAGANGVDWHTLLRSCGALETFMRTYRGQITDQRSAEFLLLDRLFPRSIAFNLSQAQEALVELSDERARAGYPDVGQRALGMARASLEYRPLGDVLSSLYEEMENVQRACTAASNAARDLYFPNADQPSWVGEAV